METLDRLSVGQREIIEGFRLHLEADGKAARTVESYCGDVAKFLVHLNGKDGMPLPASGRAGVTAFRDHLVGRGFKPATVNKAVNSLHCFERYLSALNMAMCWTVVV